MNSTLPNQAARIALKSLHRPSIEDLTVTMMPPRTLSPIPFRSDSPKTSIASEELKLRKSRNPERRAHFDIDPSGLEEHYEVLSRSDYSKEETEGCWYTPEECRNMDREQDMSIQCLEKGIFSKSTSFRGLEVQTAQVYFVLTTRRYGVIDAVMDEQENQWEEAGHLIDWDRFAAVSVFASRENKLIALENAQKDRIEALNVDNDNDTPIDRRKQTLSLDSMRHLPNMVSAYRTNNGSADLDSDFESDFEEEQ
jgi:hypothetical protein